MTKILTVAFAVTEAKRPQQSAQKSFCVEIGPARHDAGLVTNDAKTLRETLKAATGERDSSLEGIGAADKAFAEEKAQGGVKERSCGQEGSPARSGGTGDEAVDKNRKADPDKAGSWRNRVLRAAWCRRCRASSRYWVRISSARVRSSWACANWLR